MLFSNEVDNRLFFGVRASDWNFEYNETLREIKLIFNYMTLWIYEKQCLIDFSNWLNSSHTVFDIQASLAYVPKGATSPDI